jgi:hypothetical protein
LTPGEPILASSTHRGRIEPYRRSLSATSDRGKRTNLSRKNPLSRGYRLSGVSIDLASNLKACLHTFSPLHRSDSFKERCANGTKSPKIKVQKPAKPQTPWQRIQRFYRRHKPTVEMLESLLQLIIAAGGVITLLYSLYQWL